MTAICRSSGTSTRTCSGCRFAEAWPELQEQFEPVHRAILAGERGAYFAEDLQLRITRRGGQPEETFFTFSYSPVPDDTAPSGSAAC